MKLSNNPTRLVDDLGRSIAGADSDGKAALRTIDADTRTQLEILRSMEALLIRQVFLLEQSNGRESSKDVTLKDIS